MAEAECSVGQIAAITGHSIDTCQKIIDTYFVATAAMAKAAVVKLEKKERDICANKN
jgi:hypothetical protein